MVHISPDFETKKHFMRCLNKGDEIKVFNPSGLFPVKSDSWGVIEAPAYRHKWYLAVYWNTEFIIQGVRK